MTPYTICEDISGYVVKQGYMVIASELTEDQAVSVVKKLTAIQKINEGYFFLPVFLPNGRVKPGRC